MSCLRSGVCAGLFVLSAPFLFSSPRALCVDWNPNQPSIPHVTYSGASIWLTGISRDATEYRWDMGDGSSTAWAAVSNPYDLGIVHTYTGAVGQNFVATLHVRKHVGDDPETDEPLFETHSDTYAVQIRESSDLSNASHLQVRIDMAIDKGLWYLHTQLQRGLEVDGVPMARWNDSAGYWAAATGVAMDAFQIHGHRVSGDYANDPYVETVRLALNQILATIKVVSISPQAAGDPDTLPNGIGLVANAHGTTRDTYIGGINHITLASCGAPGYIAPVGDATWVKGRTIRDIVHDMCDYWNYGQVDAGSTRGGWRYYANYSSADMSTTQWPALAYIASRENMGIVTPAWVSDELMRFADYTNYLLKNSSHGAWGYSNASGYINVTKAAAGLICHEFMGTPQSDYRFVAGLGFIYRRWNDSGSSWNSTQVHGNSYGMYGVMKAMRIPEPDILSVPEFDYMTDTFTGNAFDWYYSDGSDGREGLAHYCVRTQQANGSWDDTVGPNRIYDAMCTGWRLLVLEKGVTIIPPVAQICYSGKLRYAITEEITLLGACSYHPAPNREIVTYEWDLDGDGVYDDAVGGEVVLPAGYFPEFADYPISLRVKDNNPADKGGPQSALISSVVSIFPPPHDPVAIAGGPYGGAVGVPVTLDGSLSRDADDDIVAYEWDLDNDGEFDDAAGVTFSLTLPIEYHGGIGLRVTDGRGVWDVDFTTLDIGNQSPVADANGPYTGPPNGIIVLDGTGSVDPDPGDILAYAWDLDGDGEYDDAFSPTPSYQMGPIPGVLTEVSLRVTDLSGESSVDFTTVLCVTDICGDLDVDGDVDRNDLLIFRLSLGSSAGDARFDPALDYNANGTVDYMDYREWYRCYLRYLRSAR